MEKENSLKGEQLNESNEFTQMERQHPEAKTHSSSQLDGTIQTFHKSLTLKFRQSVVVVRGTINSDRQQHYGPIRSFGKGLQWVLGKIFKKAK